MRDADNEIDTITPPTLTAAQRIMEMIEEELSEPDLTPWAWWEIPVTADTRRAAFNVDTGRHSGLALIADIEGLDGLLPLEVL